MFPNQQGRDSWGSVAGYYGNYNMGGGAGPGGGGSWYRGAGGGAQSGAAGAGWVGGAWGYGGTGAGASGGLSTGDEATDRAMMAASLSSSMTSVAEAEIFPGSGHSAQSRPPKLGINSNIYSLYQTKQLQTPAGFNSSSGRAGYSDLHPNSKDKLGPESPETVSEIGGYQPQEVGVPGSSETVDSDRAGANSSQETLYNACMQDKQDARVSGEDDGAITMEPDSSTDNQEDTQRRLSSNSGGDPLKVKHGEDATDSDNTDDNNDGNRMQRLLKEHARLFGNVKNESDGSAASSAGAKRPKTYKTAQEELSDLMKLTNEKLFKSSANGSLPLSVDTDQDPGPDSVSPQSRNPFFVTNSLSSRKRGRKPKHYSEILYELGQRGISITKTARALQAQAGPSEMVVSEGGSVSHKASGQQLKCPHCNKILTTSVGLMYHIRLHTGEKPYSCDICGKSFATSSHYHYHIRSHSGEKPYRNFRCDFCGKMYTASGSLRLHLKSHLSRLAANAFSSINLPPGFNMGQNGSMGLAGLSSSDSLQVGQNDFKFGIKQEVLDQTEHQEASENTNHENPAQKNKNSDNNNHDLEEK